jgi:hypothetical protein
MDVTWSPVTIAMHQPIAERLKHGERFGRVVHILHMVYYYSRQGMYAKHLDSIA